jgi:hypothetical protein
MPEKSTVFEKHYQDYIKQIAALDPARFPEILGVSVDPKGIRVPWFEKEYTITAQGIEGPGGGRPNYSTCVILCKYLLLCPADTPAGDQWQSYKDFKDAAPLITFFGNSVEGKLARHFSGRTDDLVKAAERIGGRKPVETGLSYDICMYFAALPQVVCLLVFNDADDEFSADCRILFQKRAAAHLDMECVAMVGSELADRLTAAAN